MKYGRFKFPVAAINRRAEAIKQRLKAREENWARSPRTEEPTRLEGMRNRRRRHTLDIVTDFLQRRNRIQLRAHPRWMSFSQEPGQKQGRSMLPLLGEGPGSHHPAPTLPPIASLQDGSPSSQRPREVGRGPAAVQPREAWPGRPTAAHPAHTSGSTFAFFSCRGVFWFPLSCRWRGGCKTRGGRWLV